jgi:hypothetical protein
MTGRFAALKRHADLLRRIEAHGSATDWSNPV